jgi:hypothetical protein
MWQLLIPVLGNVLDKIFPDKTKADEAKAKLIELQMNGELQQIMGQLEINKEEAKSADPFTSRARPFIMWTCGVAFAYASILEPVMRFVSQVWFGYTGEFPVIDTNLTMQVLLGLLGLGALRSWDKKNGTAS